MARARFRSGGRLIGAAIVVTMVGGGTALAATAAAEPALTFVGATRSVTVDRYEGESLRLDLGTYLVAGRNAFEIRAKRASYRDPIVAKQIVRSGGRERAVPLPAGLLTGFDGFRNFTHLTITNSAGATVVENDMPFCPNAYNTTRTRPDAPDRSPYPEYCSGNPFTIGSVWGVQAGWSAPAMPPWWESDEPVDVPDGAYTARLKVNQPYRDLFGISGDEVTVQLTVRTVSIPDGRDQPGKTGPQVTPKAADRLPQPAAKRPTGKPVVPKGPKPDLRSLPAWAIRIGSDLPPDAPGQNPDRDYLSFNATVWTAGQSPLVVDGFRRPGQDLMDAYQYFYDAQGRQVGFAPVGSMEYDPRDGHTHWHFKDFAQYRLLDARKNLVLTSGKEAFCLANTDAIDYTLPRANWRPEGTDLRTACGDESSLAVREVLDVGSGDTYDQSVPGQNFDITDVPNGTYFVEVSANPDGKLYETSTKNNVSLRKVILGGTKGARTVTVPPYQGIDA